MTKPSMANRAERKWLSGLSEGTTVAVMLPPGCLAASLHGPPRPTPNSAIARGSASRFSV